MVLAAATGSRRRISRLLAPVALAAVVAAVVLVVTHSPRTSGTRSGSGKTTHAAVRHLPPYWIVRPGDTYDEISAKTGLSIAQLEAFNPNANPLALVAGQRLNLWQHPPVPRPPPPGPRFWTVRSGDSLGLIADKTGINLNTLEQLNPQFRNSPLQPGDQVRLRH